MTVIRRLISKRELKHILSVSFATIDRWEAEGRLPRRIVLSSNSHGRPVRVAWYVDDIIAFLETLKPAQPAE